MMTDSLPVWGALVLVVIAFFLGLAIGDRNGRTDVRDAVMHYVKKGRRFGLLEGKLRETIPWYVMETLLDQIETAIDSKKEKQ